jgi:multidrug resistance efflux pump
MSAPLKVPGKADPHLHREEQRKPTFTWVRLAQRIPVTVHLTHVPPGVLVSAGMTCTVLMKEGAAPEIGKGIKQLITALF